MSLRGLLVHDVGIVTAATTEGRYGDAVKDWTSATTETVKGWVARRGGGTARTGNREAQVSKWVLLVDRDTTVTGADRVTWGAYVFEVDEEDGPPVRAWTPRGEHHVEVPLRYVTG